MADQKKIARQWIETDAAFGVSEAPVKRSKKKSAAVVKAAPIANAPEVVKRAAPAAVQAPVSVKPVAKVAAVEIAGAPAGDIPAMPPLSREQKISLLQKLLEETTAALSKFIDEVATRVVFGEGDVDAPVMFIGEGPGVEEDRIGRPFVGKSGQLLDKQIAAMKFAREQLYIANVVKLRAASPSEEWGGKLKDRPPTPEEVARNIVYLHKQIEIIRPKVIVTLGAPAFKHITGSLEGITKARGKWKSYRGIPVMPTLHPAYVLRNYTEETRRNVWEDLKAVLAKIGK